VCFSQHRTAPWISFTLVRHSPHIAKRRVVISITESMYDRVDRAWRHRRSVAHCCLKHGPYPSRGVTTPFMCLSHSFRHTVLFLMIVKIKLTVGVSKSASSRTFQIQIDLSIKKKAVTRIHLKDWVLWSYEKSKTKRTVRLKKYGLQSAVLEQTSNTVG